MVFFRQWDPCAVSLHADGGHAAVLHVSVYVQLSQVQESGTQVLVTRLLFFIILSLYCSIGLKSPLTTFAVDNDKLFQV